MKNKGDFKSLYLKWRWSFFLEFFEEVLLGLAPLYHIQMKSPKTVYLTEHIQMKSPKTVYLTEHIQMKSPKTVYLTEHIQMKSPKTVYLTEHCTHTDEIS